ncbi:MAG: peptidoglycan DD-metalloendopeptidase family protein [Actinobacteria bacterium]|nr:peptidoglycan DD-metalloendopeptidase family protein [Actinomycetota bacterium]
MPSSRALRALLAAFVAISVVALSPAEARAQSLEKLKKEEEAAKRAADEAAAEVTDSIGEYNSIYHEIERTKANIAAKEERATQIGDVAVDRAIEAYKGSNFEVADVFDSQDLLEASRKARLLGEVTKKDTETIDRLEVEAVDLQTEREKLADLLDQAQAIIDAKRAAEKRLEQRFIELTAKRKALEARLAAQARNRGRRGSFAGVAAPTPVDGLVCPNPGSSFTDSFGAPRSGGRRHKGTDMMNVRGAPLYAVTSGTVTFGNGGLAGKSAYLHGSDGNLYFYAHLSEFGNGGSVSQGALIGYNGATGNASGGAPHLHFEIKMGGSLTVNPYPTVRRIC